MSDNQETNEGEYCPDCERKMKALKSWGGMTGCYCLFGGRKPSMKQLDAINDPGEYERRRAIVRERMGLPIETESTP